MNTGAIACAGNWIVDLVHDTQSWPNEGNLSHIGEVNYGVGGGAANVASDLRYLDPNLSLFAIGCIGQDEFGERVKAHGESLAFNASQLLVLPGVRTSHTHVFSVRGKSRTFLYHSGANAEFRSNNVNFEALKESGVSTFYLGYPLLLEALDRLRPNGTCDGAALLASAKAAGMMTCVDLVSSQARTYKAVVEALLPHIDILVLNEVELALATGMEIDESSPEKAQSDAELALDFLLSNGVSRAVVFHTPKTACWADADGTNAWLPALPVEPSEVKSAVGAGDAFCAGILYAAHNQLDPIEALKLGHLAAGSSLQNETAAERIPTANELLAG